MIENQIHKTIEVSEDILNQIKIDKELKNDLEKVMIKKSTEPLSHANFAAKKTKQLYKFLTKSKPNAKQSQRLKLIVTFLVGFLVSQTFGILVQIQTYDSFDSSLLAKYQKLLTIWTSLSFFVYLWTIYAIWHRRVSRFKYLLCTYAFQFSLMFLFSTLYVSQLVKNIVSYTQSIQLVLSFVLFISIDLVCFVFTFLLTKSYFLKRESSIL
jgi:uncharacterized membrane protein YozB (DUF420 family)